MIVVQRFARWPAVGVTSKPRLTHVGWGFSFKLYHRDEKAPADFSARAYAISINPNLTVFLFRPSIGENHQNDTQYDGKGNE